MLTKWSIFISWCLSDAKRKKKKKQGRRAEREPDSHFNPEETHNLSLSFAASVWVQAK